MSRNILKQNNGKYCVFSSIVDDIIYYNMTKEELINTYLEEEKVSLTDKINSWCGEADKMTDKEKLKLINMIKFNKSSEGEGLKKYESLKNLLI